tara:strand:- start:434 stop:1024 length:591 start_codon:yes stop_codon:yes gene_type:complete
MEILLELATTFWQWSVLIVLILIGFVISWFDGQGEQRVGFSMPFGMPVLQPIPIETKDKGFWKGILLWLLGTRKWEVAEDFWFQLEGQGYMIPAGFQFDGASVPKFLATFLSPVGVLLIGGLVHDYGYKYATLLHDDGTTMGYRNQAHWDRIFRDICIEVNGFKFLNYLAYWTLRLAGFVAWNGHKKRGTHVKENS